MTDINHPLYQADLQHAADYIKERWPFTEKKKILVIGATGLVGSFLTDVLLYYNGKTGKQFEVYAMGRSLKRLRERFSHAFREELHLWEHDINRPMETEVDFDYVFHLASNADPGSYAAFPVETITTNVHGSIHVVEYAKRHPRTRILFTSSMEVYGENGGNRLDENSFGSIDFNRIRAGYPESKRISELLYKSALEEYGIDSRTARLGYIYGPTMTESDNKVVAQFLRAAANRQDIVLKSPGLQRRTYCYVADAVTGMLTILFSGNAGAAYNVSDSSSLVTVRQLGEMLAGIAGTEVRFCGSVPDAASPGRGDMVLDSGKLERLGWRPETGIENGIMKTLEIMRGG